MNTEAVKSDMTNTTTIGPMIEEISSMSLVTFFIMKYKDPQEANEIATLPERMNIEARP
jgi:hypothetical protein